MNSLANRPLGKTLRMSFCSAGESGRFRQILRMATVMNRCWPVLAGVRTESEKHTGQNKRNSSCSWDGAVASGLEYAGVDTLGECANRPDLHQNTFENVSGIKEEFN